jgi:hypothetical protein
MSIQPKELCPNCIDLIQVSEESHVIRNDEIYLIEKVVRYCRECHYELGNTVTLRFKRRMG